MSNKIRREPWLPYECQLCNIRTNGEENFRMHLDGSKHRRKAEIYNLQMIQMQMSGYGNDQEMPDMSSPFRQVYQV